MKKETVQFINNVIEGKKETFIDAAKQIHSFAELSLMEYKSAEYYCYVAKELGFEVEKNICDIETAFTASYSNGNGPKIAILAEYDALSGLSQYPGIPEHKEIAAGGNGHGCGHNLLGAGALGAAYAVKEWLKNENIPGTVVLCGCPGEEGGAAKAFMAKKDFFKQFDAAVTWHPSCENTVETGGCNASIQTLYKFHGVAAHASGSPEHGKSALDSVELMNIGVQFLREHMPQNARIHYAITDAGGNSPNVVQAYSAVLYMVRSPHVKEALELQKKVDKIAEGAAMMTGCSVEKCFIDGTADTIHNEVMCKTAFEALSQFELPSYSQEELAYADEIAKTYDGPKNISARITTQKAKKVYFENYKNGDKLKAILDFLIPYGSENDFGPGSTDVGDVSYQTPTVQIHTACFTAGAPGHSWQNVSLAGSSIGFKGMLHAAKAMALTAATLYTDKSLIDEAKAELISRTEDGYNCPIPDGAKPVTPDNA
ncbi:MAG: amidohydrolase [Clostridia bacterium]|nr:amidohydrolase [Clostridia bacterium]